MKPYKTYLCLAMLILVTTAAWITSCTHKADISGLPEVCFERDVLPIYTNSCAIAGCHDGRGRESGRALNSYNDIINTVVPGNPGGSSSYKAIISKWGENKMPPDQPVSLENRTIIRVWIEQGALNTVCTVAKVTNDDLLSEQRNNR